MGRQSVLSLTGTLVDSLALAGDCSPVDALAWDPQQRVPDLMVVTE